VTNFFSLAVVGFEKSAKKYAEIISISMFKGQCHEIFRLRFFVPSRNVQRRFQIFKNIRGVIHIRN
jgi:hypothetical protein